MTTTNEPAAATEAKPREVVCYDDQSKGFQRHRYGAIGTCNRCGAAKPKGGRERPSATDPCLAAPPKQTDFPFGFSRAAHVSAPMTDAEAKDKILALANYARAGATESAEECRRQLEAAGVVVSLAQQITGPTVDAVTSTGAAGGVQSRPGADDGPFLPPVGATIAHGAEAPANAAAGQEPAAPDSHSATPSLVGSPASPRRTSPSAPNGADSGSHIFEVADIGSDDAAAAWVIGKLLDRASQVKRLKAQAEAMTRELEADLKNLVYHYGQALEAYAKRKVEGGRKGARSFKALSGTLGFRGGGQVQPRIHIIDEYEIEKWALTQPDPEKFGRFGFYVDAAKVQVHVKNSGEVIPGVELVAPPEVFYVKAGDVSVNVTKVRAAPALREPEETEETEETES